jgi:hypothetical protein
MKAGIRMRWIAVLAAAIVVGVAGNAYAGAGDDAHFIVHTTNAGNVGSPTTDVVPCPTGERAIGGGVRFFSSPKDFSVRGSGPVSSDGSILDDGGVPSFWQTKIQNLGKSAVTMISYALCSASTDATVVRATRFLTFTPPGGYNSGSATASCPGGQVAIGGGLIPEAGTTGFVMANGPVDETGQPASTANGDTPRGWFAAVNANGGAQGEAYRVYAVCSSTSKATIQASSVIVSAGQGSGAGGTTGVTCPAGQRALSGGVIDNAPYAWLIASAPGGPGAYNSSINPGVATGWRASFWSLKDSNVEFKVAAVCEGPTPPTPSDPTPPPGDPVPAEPPAPPPPSSSNFEFGKFYRHKDRGIGALVMKVPGPGMVSLRSALLRYQQNDTTEAGDVGLSVLARHGKAMRRLKHTGKLRTKAKITYTPDNGTPNTQKIKLTLKLNRD